MKPCKVILKDRYAEFVELTQAVGVYHDVAGRIPLGLQGVHQHGGRGAVKVAQEVEMQALWMGDHLNVEISGHGDLSLWQFGNDSNRELPLALCPNFTRKAGSGRSGETRFCLRKTRKGEPCTLSVKPEEGCYRVYDASRGK